MCLKGLSNQRYVIDASAMAAATSRSLVVRSGTSPLTMRP